MKYDGDEKPEVSDASFTVIFDSIVYAFVLQIFGEAYACFTKEKRSKTAHMYGWDIMSRIVSGGIWRSCYIVERKKNRIDDVYGVTLDVNTETKLAAVIKKLRNHVSLALWAGDGETTGDDGQWVKNGAWAKRDWVVHATAFDFDSPTCWEKYRIPLMANQVITLFRRESDNLEDFARASQISQAEAKKYFIERFRYDREHKGGLIWWNLVDGWPQISDAVVDYYGAKKLAYHYIKRSQQALCLMLREPGRCVLAGGSK